MVKGKKFYSILLCVILLMTSMVTPLTQKHVEAFTKINADTATADFISTYWDPSMKYFYRFSDHQIHGNAADGSFSYQPGNGLYTDFWWEAQLWETVMDIYERTGSGTYLQMIADVYDGFFAQYPNWQDNNFNDDIGWWSQACMRAYEITGEVRYKNQAKAMFDYIYTSSYDTTFGGGIWWNRKNFQPQKNVCTNGSAVITAIKLYRAFNDINYLTKAIDLYNWVESNLFSGSSNGKVYDNIHFNNYGTSGTVVTETWEFSYNQGVFLYASYMMYEETGNNSYLTNAISAADWYIDKMSYDGTCNYEGDADHPAFRIIFNRNLAKFTEEATQIQYLKFLQNNASQAYNHRRSSDGIIGYDWTMVPDSSYISSIGAAAGISILNLVDPDNTTGMVIGKGIYEAENAHPYGVSNENLNTGFYGRGYIAGWNSDATSVSFPINAYRTGTYKLTFRHSAAAGNGSRRLNVNGNTIVPNLAFVGTNNWSTWSTVTVAYVNLTMGDNIVNLAYDASAGSTNYINLDRMIVEPVYQAEEGSLHNLSMETLYSGYVGSGYVAGWNSDGQWVDFLVNAPASGEYTLTFCYTAGAGNASRYLYINGNDVVNNLSFPASSSWSDYKTITTKITLNAGSNTISLIYNSTKGSTNYLNLDYLLVGQ